MGMLDGRIALVTGGADGIGAATVRRLAAEGATVVVTDINGEGAAQLATEVGGIGLHHDAGSEADWQRVMEQVRERFGRLDVLVNNAGVGGGGAGDIEGQPLADFHKVMRVCVDSTFIGCKLAIALMKEHGGAIINISSVHGIRAAGYETAYSTAKGAVRLLTKSVAQHCAGYRIRVNSVHPGYVLTHQVQKWIDAQPDPRAVMDGLLAHHPIGYLGTPEDIANGIVFLASDQAKFMTGSELVMDGGYLL